MKWIKRSLLLLLVILVMGAWLNYPKLNIISGYASKNMASTLSIAKRSEASVILQDNNVPLIKLADVDVDNNSATATVFGLMPRKTICRPGLGCTLVNAEYDADFNLAEPQRSFTKNNTPFPFGNGAAKDTVFQEVDYQVMEHALYNAFADSDVQKTRSVLVVYKNHIVAERYIDGFTKDTPILGWSMTKSVLATLFGILEFEGKIDLGKTGMVDAWKNDERNEITLNHLLRMQSGLEWDEDYSGISDVTKMLFLASDMAQIQAEKKALAKPTEIWNYSSGTSNLLSGILRNQFDSYQDYVDFPYVALIDRIGMHSMLIETDMKGNFVGSSYAWANTRDWAKFGLLYLNNGNWNGEQLFGKTWVDYVTEPTDLSDGTYGGHFWLNAHGKYPDAPKDLYSANGYQGQRVFIIPSKDLVIVRTGLAEAPDFDFNGFLKDILRAIP
ncbi:serine hydrolase domain-containing protein [Ulvibacterium marinum]|uniref:Class C beta-lactamase-related serine hydrolase n=1 Tax=Ulvibacterium marinum TaxID=2419782 RepID=A0A3B0C665_9FLAO|nr:serine hydrolase [Ulvibacterium marinum]RKN81092.1 class C beta-lactamase-related serine hydrolase [Ulvibacterium marinum]